MTPYVNMDRSAMRVSAAAMRRRWLIWKGICRSLPTVSGRNMKLAMVALLAFAQAASAQVRPGVEVFLAKPPSEVVGKRVGLITNHSGLDRQGRTTIDLLAGSNQIKLVALFAPEHGIRGTAEARVTSGTDEKTGLPVHSLYGETYKPTPQ